MASTMGSITRRVNGAVVALTEAPVVGALMRRGFVVVTYVGRRSGKTFSTPVFYTRSGDMITIGVAMPDSKKWWRNFLGEGGPISLHLHGVDRRGHAIAWRDAKGRVSVRVRLDRTA
ncbi:nitroreductase/quinone reductase family protein [Nocardia acidivorans]|uniref:nitroreductase/quinone reductase family protein n=1 Tax=Nocardia acidivorans TaxID=404580 RepID=UPI00082FA1F1|nr:nitroreductase/quinone reductase family protein [Nocardia acidivorans]